MCRATRKLLLERRHVRRSSRRRRSRSGTGSAAGIDGGSQSRRGGRRGAGGWWGGQAGGGGGRPAAGRSAGVRTGRWLAAAARRVGSGSGTAQPRRAERREATRQLRGAAEEHDRAAGTHHPGTRRTSWPHPGRRHLTGARGPGRARPGCSSSRLLCGCCRMKRSKRSSRWLQGNQSTVSHSPVATPLASPYCFQVSNAGMRCRPWMGSQSSWVQVAAPAWSTPLPSRCWRHDVRLGEEPRAAEGGPSARNAPCDWRSVGTPVDRPRSARVIRLLTPSRHRRRHHRLEVSGVRRAPGSRPASPGSCRRWP